MTNKKMKNAGLMMIAVLTFSLVGCNALLESASNELTELNDSLDADIKEEMKTAAVKQMQQKYGINFEVHDIFREQITNESTVWMHPVDNRDLTFEVSMDSDEKVQSDNYIGMKISHEITTILKKNIPSDVEIEGIFYSFGDSNQSNEINETINANREKVGIGSIDGKQSESINLNPHVTLEEYIEEYNPEYFSGYMIVKDTGSVTPEMFEEAFNEVYKATSHRLFQANVFFISQEEYAECRKGFANQLKHNSGFMYDFSPKEMLFQSNEEGFFYVEQGQF